MACFAVPVVEAVVVTVIRKVAEKKEKSPEKIGYGKDRMSGIETKIPFTRKLKWLANLYGAVLLCLLLSTSGTARWFRGSPSSLL